ncbi:MAG: hypothetical protein CMO01_07345 [Thalassobius sp.]|nr:hypothetical protein [Thalassovita sp.]
MVFRYGFGALFKFLSLLSQSENLYFTFSPPFKQKMLGRLLIILYFIPNNLYPQSNNLDFHQNATEISVNSYDGNSNEIWLPMSFGKAEIDSVSFWIDSLKTNQFEINEVSEVYSDYPKGQNFDKLNQLIFYQLQKLLPTKLESNQITFRLIKQTGCNTIEEAKKLPHGISINYVRKEIKEEKLATKLNSEEQVYIPKIDITGEQIGFDSTVLNALERKGSLWSGEWVIITDLTYSMAPFTWQILKWQQTIKEQKSVQAYIFFNDGDNTKDALKQLGNTGGIYASNTQDQDSIVRLMEKVQKFGNGGDIPENDIEVLMYAQSNYPKAEIYVLIADAQSSIRDFSLLDKLNIPVKIILARTRKSYNSIPIQYVDLALHTNGSLHTEFYDFESKNDLLSLRKYYEEKKKLKTRY